MLQREDLFVLVRQGMVMLVSWTYPRGFVDDPAYATLDHAGTCIDGGRYPKLKAYVEAILARPSFAPLVAGEKAFLSQAA